MRYLLAILIMLPVMAGDMRVTIKSAKTERKLLLDGKAKLYRNLVSVKHDYQKRFQVEMRVMQIRKRDGVLYVAYDGKQTLTLANKHDPSAWANHWIYDHEKGERYYGLIIQVYSESGSLLGEVASPASLLKKLQELEHPAPQK